MGNEVDDDANHIKNASFGASVREIIVLCIGESRAQSGPCAGTSGEVVTQRAKPS